MAGDGAVADAFDRWLDERADELGVTRETVLARALSGIDDRPAADGEAADDPDVDLDVDLADAALIDGDRLADLGERVTAVEDRERIAPERVADLTERVEDLAERVASAEEGGAGEGTERVADLDDRLTDLECDLDEKIRDVRERVVQVKRETDAKAPDDHDHGDLERRGERTAGAVEELEAGLDDLAERVDEGFENFEEVLEYLTETSDELEARAETLARATIGLRDRVAAVEAERSAREVADDIRARANRNGDATATCGTCSRRVRLGLLSRPECPHCAATFEDVEPSSGLFGSATLRVGPPPALEGETGDLESPEDLFEAHDGDGGDER